MATGFMSLAYLAEISVVFNLAFSEFGTNDYAKRIDSKFKEITNAYPDGFDFSDKSLGVDNFDHDFVDHKQTWVVSASTKLNAIRSDRIKRSPNYSPLSSFWDRALAFATNPIHKNQKKGMPYKKLIHGLLSSWIYSKTQSWDYPFCRTSIIAWALISFLLLIAGFSKLELFTVSQNLYEIGYIFCGFLLALLLPRPITHIYAKLMLGKSSVAPRAKYYALALTGVSTLSLILMIALSYHGFHSDRVWYFLEGLLVGSIVIPFLMLIAHQILEVSLENWAEWIGEKSKAAAQRTANSTSNEFEKI